MFTKNYKNLTRNHGYVLALIPFNVAYGTDINSTGKLVEDAVVVLRHKRVDRTKPVKVVFTEFGDSSINMKLIVWVDAVKKIYAVSDIMSCIYATLGQNGIEIPFPQRDLHIKNLPQQENAS
jgi:small-conductance mechanosensitive channel